MWLAPSRSRRVPQFSLKTSFPILKKEILFIVQSSYGKKMTQNLGGRDSRKMPALQSRGPKFDVQSPCLKKKKSWAWRHAVYNLSTGESEIDESLGITGASLAYLASSRLTRDPASK